MKAFDFAGDTKLPRGPHAARGPRVGKPWCIRSICKHMFCSHRFYNAGMKITEISQKSKKYAKYLFCSFLVEICKLAQLFKVMSFVVLYVYLFDTVILEYFNDYHFQQHMIMQYQNAKIFSIVGENMQIRSNYANYSVKVKSCILLLHV